MKVTLALLTLSLTATGSALVLDDFTTGAYLSDGRGTFGQTGSMIGGRRSVSGFFDDLDDTTMAAGTVNVQPASGFAMAAKAGRPSEFEEILTYPGLTSLDLGGFRSVRIEFSATDFSPYIPTQPDLGLGISVASGVGTDYRASTVSRPLVSRASPTTVEIALADFVAEPGYAPVDWRDLHGFGLYLGGTGASGGSLALRRIEFIPAPVPEPATWAALGLGTLALRRRRR